MPPSGLFVFGEVTLDPGALHGEVRLLENALGKDGDLPKDKTGEERSERLEPCDGDASRDFPGTTDGD